MYKYIIMAAGSGKRWDDHMGVPKHLVLVEGGETLLCRTVRQLKERNVENVYIVANDNRYEIEGTVLFKPNPKLNQYEIDRFLSNVELWKNENVVFLYGDVRYSDNAMDLIVGNETETYIYFGRSGASDIGGKDHAELFAIKLNKDYTEQFENVARYIRSFVEQGKHKRGLGWHTYLEMNGIHHNIAVEKLREYLKSTKLNNFVEINDDTDDFDNPEDYDTFIYSLYQSNKIMFHFSHLWLGGSYKATLFLIQKLYKDFNIEVSYNDKADKDLIVELLEYVPVNKLHDTTKVGKCVKATHTACDGLVEADEKYQWIHSDIKTLKANISKRDDIVKYITVSEFNKRQVDDYLGVDSLVLYNEIDNDILEKANEKLDLPKHDLKLVSINRLSAEKGFNYMLEMVRQLSDNNIDFKWYIVGGAHDENKMNVYKRMFKDYPQVEFVGRKLNPYPYIKWADYLVAPSTRETWHLGVNEALALNTPVIVNDIPVFHEQVMHGKNGYIFDFANDKFNYKTILKIPKVKHTPTSHFKGWYSLIGEPREQSTQTHNKMLIRAYGRFVDKECGLVRKPGSMWLVSKERGKHLKLAGAPIDIIKIFH